MKRMILIPILAIVAVVIIGIFIMMNNDSKSSEYEVSNGNLVISGGSFGITIPLSEISDVRMTDTMPPITTKINGAQINNACKGEFIVENNIKARLYVNTDIPPFITFIQNDTVFYINTETPVDTQSLYDLLK